MSLWDEPARDRPAGHDADWTRGGTTPGAGPGAPTPWDAPGGPGPHGPRAAVVVARPPVLWLGLALLVAVAAVVLALAVGRPVPAVPVAAWLLAGPVGVSLLALYARRDVLARTRPVYAAPGWVRPAYVAGCVVVLLAVAVTAWQLADWVGRL